MPSKPAWLERSEAKSKDALQTEEQQEEEEEEDYMSMAITEPSTSVGGRETYTQRQLRKQREVRKTPQCPHSRASFPGRNP